MRPPLPPRLRSSLADRTDAELLRLAREGDPRAYEAIVARYREPLRRSCARIVPDRSEDAVQQALLSAWLALERGADVRELRPWLYSIARNAAIDQARGVKGELVELGPEVPGGEDPAHTEARRREVAEVLGAVAALPERQRRALVDTALHGRATEAVAVDLGLSGGALRQLVHRARTTVRAAVPTVAFPLPAWLAELLSEEGARRSVVLLGSGSGAAVLAKATATVATVGAVVAGSVAVDHHAASPTRTATSRSATAATATATDRPAATERASSARPIGSAAPTVSATFAATSVASSLTRVSTTGASSSDRPQTAATSDRPHRSAASGGSTPARDAPDSSGTSTGSRPDRAARPADAGSLDDRSVRDDALSSDRRASSWGDRGSRGPGSGDAGSGSSGTSSSSDGATTADPAPTRTSASPRSPSSAPSETGGQNTRNDGASAGTSGSGSRGTGSGTDDATGSGSSYDRPVSATSRDNSEGTSSQG